MELVEDFSTEVLVVQKTFQVDFAQLLNAVICKRSIPMGHQRCENLSLVLSEVRQGDEHQGPPGSSVIGMVLECLSLQSSHLLLRVLLLE